MVGELNFGLLNPTIPGQVANSFYQGQQEAANNALLRAQLQHAQGANELAKYQLSSAKRADEVNSRMLADLQAAGSDQEAIRNALIRAGKPQEAFKLETDRAMLEKTKAESALKRSQVLGGALVSAHADPSDETISRALDTLDALGGDTKNVRAAFAQVQDPEQRRQMIRSYAFGTPEGLKALEAIQVKPEKVDTGGTIGFVNVNPLAGQVGTQTGPAIRKNLSPDEAARLSQSERHFQQQQQDSRVPQGYRKSASGNLEAIPGGPADLKIQGQFNQDTAALQSSTSSMDRLATAANEAMNHPGLAGTAGLRGAIPNLPGSSAADAAALLNTLKSQVAFGVLQDMRNNSKTGGALGSVSDAEGKRLEANLAALEKSQSVEQLKANLAKIIDYTQGAKERLAQAYNMRHKTAEGTGARLNNPAAPQQQPASAPTVSNW